MIRNLFTANSFRVFFFDRVEELDNKIENSIQKQNLVGITVQPHTKGKNTKYQLGTCVDILDGGNLYVWVVTTEFDDNNIAVLSRKDLSNVMYGLFKHLEVVAGNNTVFMPIIGAGNARLNRSAERILHYLIDYFDFSLSDMKVLGGIHIMIPSIKGVNLNRLENLFNK